MPVSLRLSWRAFYPSGVRGCPEDFRRFVGSKRIVNYEASVVTVADSDDQPHLAEMR